MFSPIRRRDAYALDGHGCFLLFADLVLMPSTGMGVFCYSQTNAYALDGHGLLRLLGELMLMPLASIVSSQRGLCPLHDDCLQE